VQCLQRLHGGREQWVRHGGTMFALFRLRDKGLLSDGEYARLAAAYQFLRYLEHRLQMEEDRQTHTLPNDPDPAGSAGAQDAAGEHRRRWTGETLKASWTSTWRRSARSTIAWSTRRSRHVLHHPARARGPGRGRGRRRRRSNLARLLEQRAPRWPRRGRAGLRRGIERFEHFLEKAWPAPDLLSRLEATPSWPPACWTSSSTAPTSPTSCCATRSCWRRSASRSNSKAEPLEDGAALRRFYRRQMLRIQCESMLEAAAHLRDAGQRPARWPIA
jgi:glutamate-ammonia-ligase adenylyltransferase